MQNGYGILLTNSRATIGGTQPGEGNIISGNYSTAINATQTAAITQYLRIYGNRIGVGKSGSALGNGGHGVFLQGMVQGAIISKNVIAHNGSIGVSMQDDATKFNTVAQNSIYSNVGGGIGLFGANEYILRPVILSSTPLNGTACAGCFVDVYSDAAGEGKRYEGSTLADGAGHWTFSGSITGPNATVTTTNANGSTSEFSYPVAVSKPKRPDGRIKKGSGTLVGNDIYNTTGTDQSRSGSATAGSMLTFTISVQNDGAVADSFKVAASGTTVSGYTVRYFRGTTNITSQVVAGTYQTASLSVGSTFAIKAKVTVTATAAKGSTITRLVTLTSVKDTSKKDAVKLSVQRI
jgi:hypothetical protein